MNGLFKTHRLVLTISSLAISLLLLSCSDNSSPKRHARAQLVKVASVVRTPMQSQQMLLCTLEASRTVEIVNQEEGLILEINAYQGDVVEKDQLLIKLESKLIQAKLKKAEINQRQAALDLKRIKRLRKKRLTSDEAFVQAQTTLDLSTTEKALLQIQYDHTQIKAPFSGVISQRYKEPSDIVAKYTRILVLTDIRTLKAKIILSELLLANVQLGSIVNVRIDAAGTASYPAIISRIYPTIDASTRQGTFEILLKNPPQQAKPGQLCSVILEGKTSSRLHVPLSAIKHNVNGAYVFKIVDEQAKLTPISTGIQVGQRIEITGKLIEGDKVITQGFLGLTNNKSIKIIANKNN